MMKKIIYITNVRMPTPKAHGIQIIKMSEAFALSGREVWLVVPKRKNDITESPFSYYGVKNIFKIRKIWVLDFITSLPWFGYWLETLTFAISTFFFMLSLSRKENTIYTREYYVAFISRLLLFKTVYEVHRILYPKKLFFLFVRGIKHIVTNSVGVAEEFIQNGFKDVLAYPNGIDPSEFEIGLSKSEIRKNFQLPLDKKIIMYTGNFYNWKGTETLINSARAMSRNPDLLFVFVGGTPEETALKKEECLKLGLKNVKIFGHINRKEIPKILKTADILVLPNSPISEESIKYTSPVKLGEYMASGVPIIASDLPSIRNIISSKSAKFFRPDDVASLSNSIDYLLKNEVSAGEQAQEALDEVKKYTWQKRAEKILKFISI